MAKTMTYDDYQEMQKVIKQVNLATLEVKKAADETGNLTKTVKDCSTKICAAVKAMYKTKNAAHKHVHFLKAQDKDSKVLQAYEANMKEFTKQLHSLVEYLQGP